MKNSLKTILIFATLLLCLPSAQAGSTPRPTITVSAAASMKDALTTIAKNYRGATVRFNFAASGTLQRQIENGAPVDIFISAAEKNMNELQVQNLIEANTRRDFARNRLVLIVPKNSKLKINSFADLKKREVSRVAIGAPQSVPAGKYAQQVLMKIGLWEIVQRKAVRAKDVRGVPRKSSKEMWTRESSIARTRWFPNKCAWFPSRPKTCTRRFVIPLRLLQGAETKLPRAGSSLTLGVLPAGTCCSGMDLLWIESAIGFLAPTGLRTPLLAAPNPV